MMKKFIFIASFLVITLSGFLIIKKGEDKSEGSAKIGKGFAVIELFTSEGCSSCPSADQLLESIAKEYKDKPVFVISYHVDYWNRLGWKDRFSDAKYSEKQIAYARKFKTSVYTPQAVVNGNAEAIGSNSEKLHQLIEQELSAKEDLKISLKAVKNNSEISLDYSVSDISPGNHLVFILLQNEASSSVKSGENQGKNLHHINITRKVILLSNFKSSGNVKMRIPSELLNDNLSVAAFIQNKSLEITAATLLKL